MYTLLNLLLLFSPYINIENNNHNFNDINTFINKTNNFKTLYPNEFEILLSKTRSMKINSDKIKYPRCYLKNIKYLRSTTYLFFKEPIGKIKCIIGALKGDETSIQYIEEMNSGHYLSVLHFDKFGGIKSGERITYLRPDEYIGNVKLEDVYIGRLNLQNIY